MSKQLGLPYKEITEIAKRDVIRENFSRSRETWTIPFDKIKIRKGFNTRYVYNGIEELADDIFANGLLEPLTVDVMPDATVFVEKGHRRYYAIQTLRQRNVDFNEVECFINTKSVTEFQRTLDIYSSNMHADPLKPIEQAEVALRLKRYFEQTHEQIAERMGLSRQKVDYLIKIAEEPDNIKQQIKDGNLSMADAIKLIKTIKDVDKRSDRISTAVSKAGKTPLKDALAKDLRELKELEKDSVEEVKSKAKEDDAHPKFDTSREEIKLCNNVIKNLDKIGTIASKLPKQTSEDVEKLLGYIQKDMTEIRLYVHKNKKR